MTPERATLSITRAWYEAQPADARAHLAEAAQRIVDYVRGYGDGRAQMSFDGALTVLHRVGCVMCGRGRRGEG